MLRGEFEKLLQILRPEGFLSKEDLKVLKDKVFGPQVFFVTETRLTNDFSPDAGWLVSLLPLLTWITASLHCGGLLAMCRMIPALYACSARHGTSLSGLCSLCAGTQTCDQSHICAADKREPSSEEGGRP